MFCCEKSQNSGSFIPFRSSRMQRTTPQQSRSGNTRPPGVCLTKLYLSIQFIDYAMQFIDYAMQIIDYAMYFSPGAFLSVYLSLGNAVFSISQKDATNVACSVVIFASVTVRRKDCIRL